VCAVFFHVVLCSLSLLLRQTHSVATSLRVPMASLGLSSIDRDVGPMICRERKRKQLTELQHRVAKLEAENANLSQLLARRDTEVATLRTDVHIRAPH